MLRINFGVFTVVIPLLLSYLAVSRASPLLFVLFLLSHFVLLAFVPLFNKRENLWMFILTALSFIPVNLQAAELFKEVGLVANVPVLGYMELVIYYMALFGTEQGVMGVATRFIWRNQYKIKINTEG